VLGVWELTSLVQIALWSLMLLGILVMMLKPYAVFTGALLYSRFLNANSEFNAILLIFF